MTIRATNYAGFADWNFTITVPNPPPATPANLTGCSATENSVTLAWDPESPVVGPTTFSVFLPHPYHSPRGSGGGVNYAVGRFHHLDQHNHQQSDTEFSYGYALNATAPGGTSGYAGVAASTLGPQPPANLRVTGITSTSISLAWDPSPGPMPITRYEILGWIGGLFPTIGYGSNFTSTTATITGLTPGTYEEWTVRAYDAGGNVSGLAAGVFAVNPVPSAAQLSSVAPSASGGFQFTAVRRRLHPANGFDSGDDEPGGPQLLGANRLAAANDEPIHLHRHQRCSIPDAFLPGCGSVTRRVFPFCATAWPCPLWRCPIVAAHPPL